MAKDKDHDDITELGVKMDILQNDMKVVEEDIKALTESLNKYKGIIGGVMLVFSLGAAALTLFLNYIRAKL